MRRNEYKYFFFKRNPFIRNYILYFKIVKKLSVLNVFASKNNKLLIEDYDAQSTPEHLNRPEKTARPN